MGADSVTHRTGRLLRITGDDGSVGYGEATPLPGLHTENLDEVDAVVADVAGGLRGESFPSYRLLGERIGNRVSAHGLAGEMNHPAACFGLETAAMALFANAANTTPAAVLGASPRATVPVAGFFAGSPPEAEEALDDGRLRRFERIKVKVGRASSAIDRRTIETLIDGLPPGVKLRLDANRSLDLPRALDLFGGLPPERIDFLEEPLEDPSQMGALHSQTRLNMAVDESLHDPTLHYLGRSKFVNAWIVKPGRVGLWNRIRFLAEDATKHGAACVISSCLETGIGLAAQAQMAAALPGEIAPAGLATNDLLAADMLKPRFTVTGGIVETADWKNAPSASVLEKLKFTRVA